MTQPALPVPYQAEKKDSGLTGFAGLPLYVELAKQSGLFESINQALKTKIRGWTDAEMILSLILLNLAGGDCITDIDRLEKDAGLRSQWHYLKPRHALRSIYHVFSLIWFLQFFVVSASFEMASIAA